MLWKITWWTSERHCVYVYLNPAVNVAIVSLWLNSAAWHGLIKDCRTTHSFSLSLCQVVSVSTYTEAADFTLVLSNSQFLWWYHFCTSQLTRDPGLWMEAFALCVCMGVCVKWEQGILKILLMSRISFKTSSSQIFHPSIQLNSAQDSLQRNAT